MSTDDITYIVYDGECPFCSRYVNMLRLRDSLGPVEILDARYKHPVVSLLRDKQIDLDEGMAMVQDNEICHGDECIHKLALLTTPSGIFNRCSALLFRSARVAKIIYPVLRLGRNVTLRLLGRQKFSRRTNRPSV